MCTYVEVLAERFERWGRQNIHTNMQKHTERGTERTGRDGKKE